MVKTENFQQVTVTSQSQLRDWLNQNYAQKESIWLITYKKSVVDKYISTSQVLDELLCFGWIDGIKQKIDDEKVMQLISPRRIQHWSKTYKDRYAKLLADGKVQKPGIESVQISKDSGLWDFMDDVDALIKPKDFEESLSSKPPAMQNFDQFGAASKRFMLRYIKLAKTLVTRMKRIETISMLAQQNKKLPGS
jgi:uncharacterized protein YdeI (YjbR/CyaY-like superfamily)